MEVKFDFHDAIRIVCQLHNGSVISGMRSRVRNHYVGGDSESLHLVDLAADVEFDLTSEMEAAKTSAHRLGLHWKENSPVILHLQALPAK